eukprot:266602-Amphidinium_carterae.2
MNTPLLPQGRICQLLGLKFTWDTDEPPRLYCKAEHQGWTLLMELPCSRTLSYFTKFQFTLLRRALWEARAGGTPDQFNEAYWRQLLLDPSLRVESVVSAAIDIPADEEELSFGSSQIGAQMGEPL